MSILSAKPNKLKSQKIDKLLTRITLLLKSEKYREVQLDCKKILKLDRNYAEAHKVLARLYKIEKKYEMACIHFRHYLKLSKVNSESFDINLHLIDCLTYLNRQDEAISLINQLLPIYPFEIRLLYVKAKILDDKGEINTALECYKQVVCLPCDQTPILQEIKAYAHFAISRAPALKPISEDIDAINQALATTDDLNSQSILLFAKGQGLERLNNYPDALMAFEQANLLLWKTNQVDYNKILAESKDLLKIDWLQLKRLALPEHKNKYSAKPIFIEGLPRSGTTLVESILDEIPQVTACGETTLIVNSIENAATKCQANFREMINAPTQPQLIALQKNYFKQIEQRYSPNKFFIDKTVNCHEFVGLKALAFPGAKFIYTYKKPIEAWLSLYRQKFMVGTHTYSYHAKRCALMIKLSDLYMTYWKSIFPEQIYFFSYENSIEQGSLAWQSLFEWLGFEWHDDYMNFYQNSRKVNTLSASQVREKINSQYVNRSNKYAQLLDDIRVLLELPIEELVK